ncbi:hypothetical protein Z517_03287 [Fonsecaea pedrosoi CBS 271.37]|uniref:Major facilitator superfamily (MFS) profile domain-containing protein n=1 Tax=Fonsecaea pedrosoi CBS 271.37 TaxID=1442368 RepID=A0A0D2E1Z7_9EURO|nr:uncharacterized protein Z517_03287 [Fonsecaea pedrosoi CBS 271.37]KIW84041.1 hypothetical protein Z517_03287 [Fonsecaea pedrosoi CBS 271.37]
MGRTSQEQSQSDHDDLGPFSPEPQTASQNTATDIEALETPIVEQSKVHRSTWRIAATLVALFLSLFVAALDATITATATPVIVHDLGSAVGYTWIGGAYLLANAVGAPIWGQLSDIWGRKMILLGALAIFFASSTVCAAATTMSGMIVGRALQGFSSVGIILIVQVVISDLFSLRQRSLFLGLSQGVWVVAGGCGPIIGGLFASLVTWRWCFWINLPVCGSSFFMTLLFLRVQHTKTAFRVGMKAIDWCGLLTFLAAILMVLIGLNLGGVVYPWTSAKVIVLLVVGATMFAVFIFCEARLAEYPLLPLGLFKQWSNVASLLVCFSHGLVFMALEFYLPLFFQSVKTATPLKSGLYVLPMALCTGLAGVAAGMIIHRFGRFRALIWVGTCVICLGSGLLVMLDTESSIATALGIQVVIGTGSGLLFQSPMIAIQSSVDQQDVATATGTFAFVRSTAIAVSVIITGVIFQSSIDQKASMLAEAGLPSSILERLTGKEAAANVMIYTEIGDPSQKLAVLRAFAWSTRQMFIATTAFAGLGLVAGLFVRHGHLSEEHTETVTGIKEKTPVT